METAYIHTDIIIFPHMLSDINNNLYREVVKRYSNRWTEEYGYIKDISPNIEIVSNIIQRDNIRIQFRVKCEIRRILPREGMVIKANITKVIPNGIFLTYEECMHILVTKSDFSGVYNPKDESFTVGGEIYKKDCKADIEITKCKWTKDKFSIIGKFAN